MTRMSAWALAAMLVSGLSAQDATPQAGPAKAAYEKLVADYEAANASFDAAFDKLKDGAEWKKAMAAKDNAALQKLHGGLEQVDRAGLGQRAIEAAADCKGDDAVAFYCWAATNSRDRDVTREALGAIRDDHIKSPALAKLLEQGYVLGRMMGRDEGEMMLDLIIDENPSNVIRAWAMYWKAMPLTQGRDVTDENRAKAEEIMAAAEKLAEGTELAERIAAPRFERERLQIGMVAPDIEGSDIDGTAFKLTDYRGKVVVLDFWGFW